MSATQHSQIAPVPASIDNSEDWGVLSDQLAAETSIPIEVTPDMIVGMVGSAVALLFAADAARDVNLLRGTFADPVVAQCLRNLGCLMGAEPARVVVHLVGSRLVDGHPVIRAHLAIETREADGSLGGQNQFWDLQAGGTVTVGDATCPNCGAPVGRGELVCSHCHADVRSVVDVPLLVSRLELY